MTSPMAETNSARKSRFTPRAKTAQTGSERRFPLSLLLVGVGAVLTLAVASWLGLLANGKDVSLEITEVKRNESGEVQLTGARYRGLTPAGKPYEIIAAKANEAADGSGRVDMDQPTVVLTMRNGALVNLQSNAGVFNRQTDIVSMSGAVVVTQPDRNLRLDTEALEANLKAGEMHSDVAVQVQDIDRRINADSMQVYDNGARIVFGGATKMIIKNSNAIAPTSKIAIKPKTNKAKI
ncbi:LPS export ABC transporter periplasmic protein LptC [Alphaproteobacteria bacterium]|nr:LPS export ABC transporter periplasmic protein LptC [Alphaproteobacteria bacterium]